MPTKRKATPQRRKKPGLLEREERRLYRCDIIKEEFCAYLREGLPPAQCCMLTGLSHRHFLDMQAKVKEYLEKKRLPDGIKESTIEAWGEFFEEVDKALALFQLDHIRHALSINSKREDRFMWARSMSILERRDPNNWRLKKDIEVTTKEYDKDESFL